MYLALYRKWRPKDFGDVISQPHITTTLTNEIKSGHVAHAYLFTGSRGTGKTTCSKILAKAVNCENPQDGQPCGVCPICTGIEDNSILDVVEIDAASNNGVENIRELRDEANFTPVSCKYRVYIIDEAHMLTTGAFNALLKIMEEPPAHVIFILATTEVHKVPVTIQSRCQRFDFRRIRPEDIAARLQYIADHESFSLTDSAAQLIARLADGGMRDALSLLDQCAAFSQQIDTDTVSEAAGIAGREYLFQINQAVEQQNTTEAFYLLDSLYSQSKDLERLCEELIDFYRNLMVFKTTSTPEQLVIATPEEMEEYRKIAESLKLSEVMHCLTVLQDTMERLPKVANKRLELEICLVKLCSPKLDARLDSILRRLDQLESQMKYGKFPPDQPQKSVEPTLTTIVPSLSESRDEPVEKQESLPEDSSKTVPKPKRLECWSEILQDISTSSPPLYGILHGSQACVVGDKLLIQSPNTLFKSTIVAKKELLNEIIFRYTGKKYRILMKSTKQQVEEDSPLNHLLEQARESGIPVEEE